MLVFMNIEIHTHSRAQHKEVPSGIGWWGIIYDGVGMAFAPL